MFLKIVVLKNFTIFTENSLRWSLFTGLPACNFIKNGLQHNVFLVNTAKFLKTTFFIEDFWWLLLNKLKITTLFSNKGKYIYDPLLHGYISRKNFSEAEHLEATNCS